MKNPIKYLVVSLVVILVLVFSFKIEKLDVHNASKTVKAFNASEYAQDVWENKLPAILKETPAIIPLIEMLQTNKEKAFDEFGKKLGISKTWYFMAKGEGVIESVEEDFLRVNIDENRKIQLATSFIFGNAVRDASGAVNIDDFINMTDFNNVSVALNKLVKVNVAGELKKSAKQGMRLKFAGAFEINEENTDLSSIRVIPVSVNFNNE